MAILLDTIPGLAADYSGAISVLKQMGGYVVSCGPVDCLSNYIGMEETAPQLQDFSLYSSDTDEVDAIFGMETSLVELVVAHARQSNPPFIALVGTPVSAVVGADLGGLANQIEGETGIAAIAIDVTGFDPYPAGIEKTYAQLLARFVEGALPHGEENVSPAASPESYERIPDSVNILGYTHLDYCNDFDLKCLARILERRGEEPACVIGRQSVQELPQMLRASRSLVMSAAALPLARRLERLAGIPYSCDLPIGGDASPTGAPSAPGARTLIVGDQVMSYALRQFIEARYGAACDIATFYRLDAELSRTGDVRIKSERDLAAKAGQGYSVVVADPMCAPVVLGHQAFIGLPRPALSSLIHRDNHVPLFTAEIVRDLDRAFSRIRLA